MFKKKRKERKPTNQKSNPKQLENPENNYCGVNYAELRL